MENLTKAMTFCDSNGEPLSDQVTLYPFKRSLVLSQATQTYIPSSENFGTVSLEFRILGQRSSEKDIHSVLKEVLIPNIKVLPHKFSAEHFIRILHGEATFVIRYHVLNIAYANEVYEALKAQYFK